MSDTVAERAETGNRKFEEYSKKCNDKTSVWHYCLRSRDGQQAQCKECKKCFQIKGSTSTLLNHLRNVHALLIKRVEPPTETAETESSLVQSLSKKRKMTDFFKSDDCYELTICRMVALDGVAMSLFCTSEDIRRLFKKNYGKDLPKSPNTIRQIVLDTYTSVKTEVMQQIQDLKKSNINARQLALTFDEWTSGKNRRYINLNVHSHIFNDKSLVKNLGLIRIVGSMPAEICVSLVKTRLASFGISLDEDIIGMTTDGASVMIKVGRLTTANHQLCLAHGIQLAIHDVMYKKETINDFDQNFQTSDDDSDSDNENDNDGINIEHTGRPWSLNEEIKGVIKKVRSVVKKFRGSATKNDDILQKHVKADFGHELQLLLDCKTRWSSLATMIGRYLMLKNSVEKALIDMKSTINLDVDEVSLLQCMYTSLNVMKETVEVLCRKDANLLTADTSLKFMLKTLESREDAFTKKITAALKRRITDRRLHIVTGTLLYLNNFKNFDAQETDEVFRKPIFQEIKELICTMAATSTPTSPLSSVASTSAMTIVIGNQQRQDQPELSFKEQLNQQLSLLDQNNPGVAQIASPDAPDLATLIHIEMAVHEGGGKIGNILSSVYNQLLSIPPTSVESERAFSAAGVFCNRMRTRLSDESLDAMMFLRFHFLSKRGNKI